MHVIYLTLQLLSVERFLSNEFAKPSKSLGCPQPQLRQQQLLFQIRQPVPRADVIAQVATTFPCLRISLVVCTRCFKQPAVRTRPAKKRYLYQSTSLCAVLFVVGRVI